MLIALAIGLAPDLHAAVSWPQEIDGDAGTLVIYQPQPERLDGHRLTARAAISIELTGRDEAIFGAMWFTSRIETDTHAGTARVLDIEVTEAGWPDSKDTGEQRLMQIVEAAFPEHGFEISLERLSASLETADVERRSLENLNDDPPEIRFAQRLSVLLPYDGAPRFEAVDDTPYERVVNTPFLVVRDERGKLYLSDGQNWYSATDPLGPWAVDNLPPEDLVHMVAAAAAELAQPEATGPAPEIVVATAPTELIVTDGAPEWQSLSGGEILYASNTETPWLRHLPTGNMYLLLSGRWFRASGQDGPWTFVPADDLPDAFARIPPASEIGGLRTSVAGTEEAEAAMLDAAIPQTAAISRANTTLSVEYDGKPEFQRIKGTEVAYAMNTPSQVLKIDDAFYAVDNGVWFTSGSATGPWSVADDVPEDEIAAIPADSPMYNVTHVHVYDSTPDVVYVGYTPGYLWSYPYHGVPVYGTGWYYPPYWGGYYYPRPPTWGFHVGYNPWAGWTYGVSWSNGFFSLGVSWGGGWGCCGGGWYGGGYRGPTIINTGDINIGNNINIGNRTEIANRISDKRGSLGNRTRNLYDRTENRTRLAEGGARDRLRQARPSTDRANNVFAGRDGNIARNVGDRWESRESGQWRDAAVVQEKLQNVDRSVARERVNNARSQRNFQRNDFNRARQARSRGAARELRRPARPARMRGGRFRR